MEKEKVETGLEEKVESKVENKELFKNKRNLLIIVFIFFILVIGVVGYLTKFSFILSGDNKENNSQQENEIVDDNGSIDVYCKYSWDDCWLTASSSEFDRFFYKIETETSNPKVLAEAPDAILFYDNGVKIFLQKDKKVKKINLENSYNKYQIVMKNKDLIGIVYKNDNVSGYYDNKLNRTIYNDGKLLNDAYNENYILYLSNNVLSVYDKYNSKILKENLNLDSNYTRYTILEDHIVDENGVRVTKGMLGIFATNDNNSSVYYNLEKNKTLYKDQYFNINQQYKDFLIGSKKLNSGKGYDTVDYILDSNEEKILLQPKNPNVHMSFSVKDYNGKYYFIESTNLLEPHYYTKGYIYSNDKKLITEVNYYPGDYSGQDYITNAQGELLVRKDNIINKYNIDGKLLESKKYEKIINLTTDYINEIGYLIVVNDGKLIIQDTNFKQKAEIIDWKDNYQFNQYPPLYLNYQRDLLENDIYFEKGIYMVLENGKNYTEYYFNPENNKITSRKINELNEYELYINWADLS